MSATSSKRSSSSYAQRAYLRKHYVIVPELNPRVDLARYIFMARNVFDEAIAQYKRGNLVSSYIELEKFVTLTIERFRTHPRFVLPNSDPKLAKEIEWVNKARLIAVELLEEIVKKLDEERDRQLEHELEMQLLEAFEETESATETTSSSGTATDYSGPYVQNQINVPVNVPDQQTESPIIPPKPPLSSLLLVPPVADTSTSQPEIENPYPSLELPQSTVIATTDTPVVPSTSSSARNNVGVYQPSTPLTTMNPQWTTNFSPEILALCRFYAQSAAFHVPPPCTSRVDISLASGDQLNFFKDDFHTSFAGFLTSAPSDLQMSPSAMESNRCFFVHLGIAVGIHPFLLQLAFRVFAHDSIQKKDCWYQDVVSTIIKPSDLVDANALCFLWPKDFDQFRILFVSNHASSSPILTHFGVKGSEGKEVILLCSNDHFTLLRPVNWVPGTPICAIDDILSKGKRSGCLILENEVDHDVNRSIKKVIDELRCMR